MRPVCFNATMGYAFKSIAIIGRYMSQNAVAPAHSDMPAVVPLANQVQTHGQIIELVQYLASKKIKVCVEEKTARYAGLSDSPEFASCKVIRLEEIGQHVDLVIVLGGDGTMLSAARAIVGHDIPLIGINRGRFGFLTDISAGNMLVSVEAILAGQFTIERRMLLSAEILRSGEILEQGCALNDVIIKSGLRLIELEVNIDGQFVHKQRSDGLIVSTPTGTTAYALSSGGPILHPKLEAIALVPISPHTLSNRPIAISSASTIQVCLVQADTVHLSLDGQMETVLQQGDKVIIKRAEQTVPLLHLQDYSYYEMLRNKLNWG